VIGGLTGILAGMFGIGGGSVFVPTLYLLLPFTDIDLSRLSYLVIGTSLLAAGITSISSGTNHFLADNVDKKKAIFFVIGSVSAAIISTYFVVQINPFVLKLIFAVVIILVALKMLFETGDTSKKHVKSINNLFLILFGLFAGAVAAFAGVGGGVIFVPILFYFTELDIKRAIGTSAVIVAFTTISAALSYLFQKPQGIIANGQIGYVYLLAAIPLGLGAALGAFFGVKIVLKAQSKTVKKIFSLLLILIVLKIVFEF